jgi:hemoglobin-like flavoprotein
VTIHESLESIMSSGETFGSSFYEIFFERCPAAKDHFDGTDMKRQSLVLTMALQLLEQYHTKGFLSIEQYLQTMGARHVGYGVPKEMYVDWRESMLTAMERFHGNQWDDKLASQWGDAIELATDVMFRGYNDPGKP